MYLGVAAFENLGGGNKQSVHSDAPARNWRERTFAATLRTLTEPSPRLNMVVLTVMEPASLPVLLRHMGKSGSCVSPRT
jgi:hypothetical protein